ncbi:MAG: hypothetical protein AB7K24_24975 [Gemmataceae bacterium]
MTELSSFIGTWRASLGFPYSDHTFTWQVAGEGLHGSWVIEAADSPEAREAAAQGRPTRWEIPIESPWLEAGVLFFRMNNSPFVSEFRLTGPDEAVVGAAVDKLPAELTGPSFQRSIEGHRVRLTRQSETTA